MKKILFTTYLVLLQFSLHSDNSMQNNDSIIDVYEDLLVIAKSDSLMHSPEIFNNNILFKSYIDVITAEDSIIYPSQKMVLSMLLGYRNNPFYSNLKYYINNLQLDGAGLSLDSNNKNKNILYLIPLYFNPLYEANNNVFKEIIKTIESFCPSFENVFKDNKSKEKKVSDIQLDSMFASFFISIESRLEEFCRKEIDQRALNGIIGYKTHLFYTELFQFYNIERKH